MTTENILVLGGAGFVGSNLCAYLARDVNKRVYSLDNYFTGSKKNHVAGVNYIEGSTNNINEICDGIDPHLVYHLAEYSRVEKSFDEPALVWEMSALGIMQVLTYCKKNNAKLVYAGSSTKFGGGGVDKNSSPYAFLKSQNSTLVNNFSNWYGLKHSICYFYNVYGPGEISDGAYSTVIGKFSELHQKNIPLPVVHPGTQKRNFTHVDDIVSGLDTIANHGSGDGYGIGHSEEFSILDVAKMFGGSHEILPARQGNRMTADLITTKTKDLGWRPKKNLRSYIESLKVIHS
jgi:UDP-glucose 4-epimerase